MEDNLNSHYIHSESFTKDMQDFSHNVYDCLTTKFPGSMA